MSGFLKSIGKVFKSVFKVVKKILPYALAIGAVVLTGGAALGVLPAMSTMMAGAVGGLGLSAGVMGALTSAVTMAGIGGGIGLLTGGKKGLLKGALLGGVAGAAGGLLGVTGGGAMGLSGGGGGLLGGGASQVATGAGGTVGVTGGVVTPAAAGAVTGAAPAAAGGGGLGSLLGTGGIGSLLGPALQGLGGGIDQGAQAKADDRLRKGRLANYDITGGPLDPNAGGLLSPFSVDPALGNLSLDPNAIQNQWVYDANLQRMVRRAA